MNLKRKKRIIMLSAMIVGVGITVSLVLFALNKNINVYYTPSQLVANHLPTEKLRIGGLVKRGSLKREPGSLRMTFIVTDLAKEIPVSYEGVVPSLFREGQGVIVEGRFIRQSFSASQVLAKHDENYTPPGIKK